MREKSLGWVFLSSSMVVAVFHCVRSSTLYGRAILFLRLEDKDDQCKVEGPSCKVGIYPQFWQLFWSGTKLDLIRLFLRSDIALRAQVTFAVVLLLKSSVDQICEPMAE